ncbi:unnamed protein product [Cuscuta epithymum]|nr:unnamed protein product [Cuscuta epithymum]
MAPRRDPDNTPTNAELAQSVQQLAQFMHTLGATVLQNNQNQNNGNDAAKRVASRNPPSFHGQEDPRILENWLRLFDKLFDAVSCPEEQRVDIAVYYLQQEADNWWVSSGPTLRQQPDFNWEAFKIAMRKRFYPAHVQATMRDEFIHLKQMGMSVQEYHNKFVDLAPFAKTIVPDESTKVEKFIYGLNYDTQKIVAVLGCQTPTEAYDRAAVHYRVQQLQRERNQKMKRDEDGGRGEKRVTVHPPTQQQEGRRRRDDQGGRNFHGQNQQNDRRVAPRDRHFYCKRCGRDHPDVNCDGSLKKMFQLWEARAPNLRVSLKDQWGTSAPGAIP